MGAWGVLAFDNDDANDWAAQFDEGIRDLTLVDGALAAVERERSGYLNQGLACEALAACEILARLQGRSGFTNGYTSKVDAWVAAYPIDPPGDMLERAARVIDRITGADSELRELWDDAGASEWLAAVGDLRERVLSGPPQPASHTSGGSAARRFELVDDDHAKFWEISRSDARVTVHFGRLKTRGQVHTREFPAETAAMEHVAKLILEKKRRGYREVRPDGPPAQGAVGAPSPGAALAPPDGPLRIGTVQFPAGHRVAHDPSFGTSAVTGPVLWISTEAVTNAGTLVAASRRETGSPWSAFLADDLSPGDGRPWDHGEFVPGDAREIARFDPSDVLADMWERVIGESGDERDETADERAPFGLTFPGLAPPGPAPAIAEARVGFRRLFSKPAPPQRPWSQLESRPPKRIGVVAADRAADIIAVLGWQGAVNVGAEAAPMSAVLRSWEDRFGAVVAEVGFDTLVLIVERPPRTLDHALAVAAEHYAFCYDTIMQGAGSLTGYAPLLVDAYLWTFWWD